MSLPANPVDELLPMLVQALETWKAKNTPALMTSQIHSRLDKARDQIVLKLLGFDNSYGGWHLDHCNGRAGNSTAGDYLAQTQAAIVKEWLSTVAMPELSQEDRDKIRNSMQDTYLKYFRDGLRNAMIAKANADIAVVMEAFSKSDAADKYLKVLGLIKED